MLFCAALHIDYTLL